MPRSSQGQTKSKVKVAAFFPFHPVSLNNLSTVLEQLPVLFLVYWQMHRATAPSYMQRNWRAEWSLYCYSFVEGHFVKSLLPYFLYKQHWYTDLCLGVWTSLQMSSRLF